MRRPCPRRYLVGLIIHPPHRRCRCRLRAICPAEASSPSLSGGDHVVHRPFVLWRPCPRHFLMGPRCRHRSSTAICPAEVSSPSLSGGGHIVCPPPTGHCCRCCCYRPRAFHPAEASSDLSLSGRGLVIHPPHCRGRCLWAFRPTEALSSESGEGLVIRPPDRRRHPWAICPAEASTLSLSLSTLAASSSLLVCPR